MATWKTAADLSRRYLVGQERLVAYSRRGNLPMYHGPSGEPLFDEDIVALLFRSRRAPALTAGANLGVLGDARLGSSLGTSDVAPPIDAREARRREVWRQRRTAGVDAAPTFSTEFTRRTGTK